MPLAETTRPPAGLTTLEVARRYRVGRDKVLSWIKRGELAAVNTAPPLAKPRWVILPEALADFERGRQAPPPARQQLRRKQRTTEIDFIRTEFGESGPRGRTRHDLELRI
jgi:hypothetical protein